MSRCDELYAPTSYERSVQYRIGEVDVAVRSDLSDVLADFSALYRGCQPSGGDASKTIEVEVATTRRRWTARRRYRVFGDAEPFGPELYREQVIPMVEWGINHRVVARRTEFLQVHAATLTWQGRGVVFPGQSGSGKSTLSAGLLSRGWKYLSDEFALISPETLCVHPFPKALCIKAGAFEIVRKMNYRFAGRCYNVKGYKGRVGYINPLDRDSQTVGEPSPIRSIVFLRYAAESVPHLWRMSPAAAAFELARHSMNRSAFGSRAIRILADVVQGAECFALESGALEDTCEIVERMVRG